ncbi:BppU family phage baseplate upper protein [Staphylococcus capitis]|uniref:BppU family phage baseplate upper protein n=1 Tax=Staphylococcus capitis TaxID=29388 RepID=UPI001D13932C|nr:BppU family phage baseplate upper protein [Staphylococcus capitis]MCC3755487.1 BppU family phage baseplate upper protein [Staphylococcus capitis]MDH8729597.1 BppU family phage baseplate upper protein [Staphylococcus capitis]MDH8729660.1 BppU family phage baseplate upper protein [Staphylococcus capitis]MDH8923462.1 BppU family phage baseplate upper protein [Staphylococcus capitis]MDH8944501.1 BppU family phage baseplate upper protein [Staphylococcus capitis]
MIIKMGEVETHINPRNIDIGDIGSRFYTEDENTAFIRIRINYNGSPVDLTKTDMKPKLDLFMEDGSVFIDETIEVLIPEIGLIKYDIPSNVIKHIGKVNCKLFMDSLEHSVHVANFSFSIVDSGVEKVVSKEISLNLVKDTVKQIMSEDLTELLDTEFKDKLTDDLENYVLSHNEEFKGEKGDKGDVGERGPKGEQGPPGKDGRDGVNGKDGSDGKSFDFESLTEEQKAEITPKLPDFSNWQKYKLTNDDGNIITLSATIDMNVLEQLNKTGFYYCTNLINTPDGRGKYGYINVYNQGISSGYAIYREYNSNCLYINMKYASKWTGWKLLNPNYKEDTGWISLAIKNNYETITDLNYEPSYRVIDHGNYKKVFVRLGVIDNSPGSESVVASIPKELNPYDVRGFGVSTDQPIPVRVTIVAGDIMLQPNSFSDSVSTYYQGEWII